jgi:DNA-3-methyladenine glycosylase II
MDQFMMFCLGRANILPVGDLAVRKAMKRLYNCSQNMLQVSATAVAEHMDLPGKKEMETIAENWSPYRTLGSWYMWHVLETKEASYVY